jgi:hypothetical protein
MTNPYELDRFCLEETQSDIGSISSRFNHVKGEEIYCIGVPGGGGHRAIFEAGVWIARKSRIILGHFRALEPLHVGNDG